MKQAKLRTAEVSKWIVIHYAYKCAETIDSVWDKKKDADRRVAYIEEKGVNGEPVNVWSQRLVSKGGLRPVKMEVK